MLTNINFGKYYERDSVVHKLSPVFKIISLSLSINDFKANPYCLLSLSASSSDILSTSAISFVILSPPRGIVFV